MPQPTALSIAEFEELVGGTVEEIVPLAPEGHMTAEQIKQDIEALVAQRDQAWITFQQAIGAIGYAEQALARMEQEAKNVGST